MLQTNHAKLRDVVLKKGYRFFQTGAFNVNIVGVRSRESKSNNFDDTLLVAYLNDAFKPQLLSFPITTDPGKPWLLKPLDPKGCALVVPGQYPGAYMVGVHGRSHKSGGYEALEQVAQMAYVRDNTRDEIINRELYKDQKNIFWGNLKTNIHHAGATFLSRLAWRYQVDKFSAGCQVFEYYDHFLDFMALAKKSARIHGNRFTYTLLEEEDFV